MFRNNLIRFGVAPLFAFFVMVISASADVLFYDFSSQPPNTRFLDPTPSPARPEPRIEDGILKLTDAADPGNFAGFAIGPFPTVTINALQATWRSRIGGGGGGGADGYSLSIGTDLADNFTGEEGTGTGLSVCIDTFDNGVALDPAGTGLEIKWGGAIVASTHVNKDNAGDGVFLRKDTFVDAAVSVSPSGAVCFIYDGVQLTAQIPGFAGLEANQYIFGARTGGANDNQWIDDLRIVTSTPATQLLGVDSSTWSYKSNKTDNPPAYDPPDAWTAVGFDDSAWPTGVGLFGLESGIAAYAPWVINTPIDSPQSGAGPLSSYIRTHFNWSGSTDSVTLRFTNYMDDGILVYLNGVELFGFNVPETRPLPWDTLALPASANPLGEGVPFITNVVAGNLVAGDNVIAVVLHQQANSSSDNVFGMSLVGLPGVPATIVNLCQPTNQTIFANRSATLSVEAIGSPAVTYQWYKDGVAIDPLVNATAATSSLVLSNVQDGDAGSYFARVANSLGSADSRAATLTVLPAIPLKVLRAIGSLNLQSVTIVYDQFVDVTSATDPFNYAVAGFGIDPTIVLNADGQSVTLKLDAPQSPGANYCVEVSGVLSGAGLPLDPNPTTVCYQTFVVSCGFAVQENYNAIPGVLLTDLEASPKYPGAPDLVRYRSFAGINTADEFDNYGARLSGFVIPPVSGNYVFYLAADDQGDLWLSTDSSPANLVKIADEPVWSGRRTWTGAAGGGGRDGASVSGGPQQNISGPIALVAGQMYYFQARMKEGGGGDNLDIAWQLPGELPPLNGSPSIPAAYLASLADPVNASLTVNTQPQNQRIVLSPGGGGASPLLSQDFNAGDGGFTVDTTGAPANPWTYNAASGSWSSYHTDPCGPAQNASRLVTPSLTVTRAGAVSIELTHRYSFEPDQWDGGQMRVSINGGPFVTVPTSAFSEGGYNASAFIGNHQLQGQAGWNANSANYAGGANITSRANLGFFSAGETVQIQLIGAWDECTTGSNPSWLVDAVTITEGVAAQQPARFTVAATAVVGGSPSSTIFYQWERDCGSGFALIPGANAAVYTFEPRLADNGCKYRVRMYVPGATALSSEATLEVVQPNTPPSFTCGPAPAPIECGGAGVVTVPNWATDIQVHSITRQGTSFSSDFSSQPAGTRLVDPGAADGVTPRIEDGVLKLSNGENLGVGGLGGFGIGPFPVQTFDTIDMSWKSLVGGGGGGGADGYSINIGNDLVDSFTAEEGTGTGISVTVDTFDNGTGLDVGIDFKWKGNRVAYIPLPKDDDGSGNFLRKDTFVDAALSVTAGGAVTLTYDGNVTTVQLPDYAGVPANQVILLAREGGANDRHWIDDLTINAFPADASSAEAGQTVHFNVSNDNPGLFSAQPAVSANGTLTYTLAAGASGSANVTVVAQDDGGTADGGRDTSTACTFVVQVSDTAPPSVTCPANITVDATSAAGAVVTYSASGSDSCGAATVVCAPASGSTFAVGTATVTCTATDGAGLTATCSFTVTVNPFGQPPVAVISSEQLIDLRPEFENPVLLSCNWWNACLVADAWSSSGVEPLTYLWFLEGDPTPIGAGPVITNCLEVGTHTIILVVTDANGLSAEARRTIEVVTAPLAIDLLIEQINEAHKNGVLLDRKTKRELIATLQVALNHAGDNELRETQKALDAFEKKVRAQVADTYPVAAQAWIRWSQAVSAGMEKCIKPPRKPKDHHDDKKDADDDKR